MLVWKQRWHLHAGYSQYVPPSRRGIGVGTACLSHLWYTTRMCLRSVWRAAEERTVKEKRRRCLEFVGLACSPVKKQQFKQIGYVCNTSQRVYLITKDPHGPELKCTLIWYKDLTKNKEKKTLSMSDGWMTLNSLEEVFYIAKIWPAATNGKFCVRNFLCHWSDLDSSFSPFKQ